jgi:serine phosphatase RsbU (regulator of sigma subunit)
LLLSLLALLPILSLAQTNDVFTLTAASLQNGQAVELDKLNWKYAPGDDPAWADPQFDDRAWETLNGTAITLDSIPKSGWRGIGWFRLRLKVDPALAGQPLALVMVHYGASEIYLDGKLVERFGTVGTTPEAEVEYNPNTQPFDLVLDGRSEHVIAVRHSCMALRDASSWRSRWLDRVRSRLSFYDNRTSEYGRGFGIRLQEAKQAQIEYASFKLRFEAGFWFICGVYLIIGLLYLLLYWFYPRQRANLFFGLAASALSITFFVNSQLRTGHQGTAGVISSFVFIVLLAYAFSPFAMAFFYSVFSDRLPRWFGLWIISAGLFLFLALFNLYRFSLTFFLAVVTLEILRVTIQAIRKGIDGAWLLGIGLVFAGVLFVLNSVNIASGKTLWFMPIVLTFSLILPPSILLARRFARTSLHLEDQLIQVEQLSAAALEHEKVKAENERRARELEEARQLQLSMLPKNIPQLPYLEIAAYMKTATEVGGDYYDFHLGEDGTLTVAVGDATGHGLKAGTMVTAVKSLFDTLAYHPDIPHIFERLSRTLKRMNLRGLFMAMTMVKVNGRKLSVSIAGMPSVLIYRAAAGEVEEVVLRALPLGGMTNYQYQQQELTLAADDVIVLMSDGLAERFNANNEMLDYALVKRAFAEAARQTPQQIIEHLVAAGEAWAEGRAQDDDVTLVILKVNKPSKAE